MTLSVAELANSSTPLALATQWQTADKHCLAQCPKDRVRVWKDVPRSGIAQQAVVGKRQAGSSSTAAFVPGVAIIRFLTFFTIGLLIIPRVLCTAVMGAYRAGTRWPLDAGWFFWWRISPLPFTDVLSTLLFANEA